MKLDKWPEEIECDGWRWKKELVTCDLVPLYRKIEKLHTPPTMRKIMEHLLKGGWVRYGVLNPYHYKLDDAGKLKVCINRHTREWLDKADIPYVSDINAKLWFLIQPGEWFEGGEMSNQPKFGEWIKCSERLPEVSDAYLVCRFKNDRGSNITYSVEHKGWNVGFHGERDSELFPSHWMFLPEAPNE